MRTIIRRVRINDRIPYMMHNDINIRHAYRNELAIVDDYDVGDPTINPYAGQYFCIESLEDNNTITFTKHNTSVSEVYEIAYHVSTDLQNWTRYDNVDGSWTINTGDKLYFKALAPTFCNSDPNGGHWQFSSDKHANISGNILSLMWYDDFYGKTTLHYYRMSCCFCRLFSGWNNLIDASNLVLPVTTFEYDKFNEFENTYRSHYCYALMFYGCSSLVNAPKKLPATTLSICCYEGMFYGCTSLTTAPKLPATTLDASCYSNMFNGCSSLVNAPKLPATTLADYCYQGMFRWCTNLEVAPDLPAETIPSFAYHSMFAQCQKLKYCKCLAINDEGQYPLYEMFYNISTNGIFVKNPNTLITWSLYAPSTWTIIDA